MGHHRGVVGSGVCQRAASPQTSGANDSGGSALGDTLLGQLRPLLEKLMRPRHGFRESTVVWVCLGLLVHV